MSDYTQCPRCDGDCQVYAYASPGDDKNFPQGEYFQCPLCIGTGTVQIKTAEEYYIKNGKPKILIRESKNLPADAIVLVCGNQRYVAKIEALSQEKNNADI